MAARLTDAELEAYRAHAAAEHNAPLAALVAELQAARQSLGRLALVLPLVEGRLELIEHGLGELGRHLRRSA
jgi:hypothetical protein